MPKKIISICIPTYNGAKTIGKTLDAIIANVNQVTNLNESLEIILTDDCSSDDTVSILKTYKNNYNYIQVFKNEKNLGMDGNFRQCALNATGEYIWFSGQDDIFLDGSIEHIIDAVTNEPSIGVINVNFSQYSDKNKRYICKSMFGLQSFYPEKINFDRDLLFNNAEEYFKFFNDIPSFLPATIMRRSFWITTDNKAYLGTYFI